MLCVNENGVETNQKYVEKRSTEDTISHNGGTESIDDSRNDEHGLNSKVAFGLPLSLIYPPAFIMRHWSRF